ncbi:LysR family transcriptional regulator [Piscinibacter koreensis]|uniref:LysR family transcriptional regulator n=1 Tax=Piscinibacter koreensis TaxID=2742824 RepID=A0A7Y6TVA4_9BURK|nr:LysR family transcriptional regulator [Schlegelella koreensis]NUZ04727.1 LysR family transcriptional regulator [Schlegelella koreensis]
MYENIRELVFFLRVSEETSFSAAARSLDLDPSTISKVVQRLENRLGVRLFHRTSRVLKLTQEGERFLSAAQKVMQALEEAEESLGPASGEVSGTLRVSSTPAFARGRLAPLMASFVEQYPGLRVEFVLAATPPDLFEQQIDVSFQSGSIPDSTLVARRVASTRWRICAAPAYLARAGVPTTPDDLAHHQCLNFLQGAFRSQWPLRRGDEVHTVVPKSNLVANNGDMLCALAVAGNGLARLADYHVADDLAAGRLVTVLDDYANESEPIFAVYPSRRHLSPRVRAFLDHVEAHFGGERAPDAAPPARPPAP